MKLLANLLLGAIFVGICANRAHSSPIANKQSDRDIATSQVSALKLTDRVTSVSQLADVQPTDWAHLALSSLFERYGVAGYPDGRWRGNRALTRYEFAAGLQAVVDRLDQLIAAGSAERIERQDLAILSKLQAEFATELAILGDRVSAIESRTTELAANQFAPYTKLNASAIFAISHAFVEAPADENTVLQQRVRLNFDTSFTGKDRLRTRLAFGNFEEFDLPTQEGRLGFESNSEGKFELGDLEYRLPIGEKATVYVQLNDAGVHDFTDVLNPFLADSDLGAISRFGRRNPIYRLPNTNAGIGASIQLSEAINFDLGYLAGVASSPSSGAGLFNGDYGAIAQVTLTPNNSDRFGIGLTYIHSYAGAGQGLDSGTGSFAATLSQLGSLAIELPIVANSYGIQANYQINSNLAIGGWIGYTAARAIGLGDAQIWNYAVTIAFPDLGKEGNLGGLVVGMQPKLTGTSDGLRAVGQFPDPDTSLHIEGFYRHQLSDNIAITPGLIYLTAPNHDRSNNDIVIGTIRTTFEF